MAVEIQKYDPTNIPNGALPGTQMCDSPVVVSVFVGAGTFPAYSSMHRAIVRVKDTESGVYRDISFAAENGDHFSKDISGALRALIGDIVFDPNDNNFRSGFELGKPLQYSLSASCSYLLNGVFNIQSFNELTGYLFFAVHGRLTERERYELKHYSLTHSDSYVLSRKPDGVEEYAPECTPFVSELPIIDWKKGLQPSAYITTREVSVFSDPWQPWYAEFCFINRLGGVETVCARTLEALSLEVKPEVYGRVGLPSRIPRTSNVAFVHQPELYDVYAMSSGPVNRAWAQWWSREFLTASAWWVRITPGEGLWVPCTVASGNKVSVYNRSASDALHVDFDVTFKLS